MKLHQDTSSSHVLMVGSVNNHSVSIASKVYEKTLLLTQNQVMLENWEHIKRLSLSDFSSENFEAIKNMPVDLVLIGTGTTQVFPDSDFIEAMFQTGKPVEYMTTDAACRTYNLLAVEGRVICAILIF